MTDTIQGQAEGAEEWVVKDEEEEEPEEEDPEEEEPEETIDLPSEFVVVDDISMDELQQNENVSADKNKVMQEKGAGDVVMKNCEEGMKEKEDMPEVERNEEQEDEQNETQEERNIVQKEENIEAQEEERRVTVGEEQMDSEPMATVETQKKAQEDNPVINEGTENQEPAEKDSCLGTDEQQKEAEDKEMMDSESNEGKDSEEIMDDQQSKEAEDEADQEEMDTDLAEGIPPHFNRFHKSPFLHESNKASPMFLAKKTVDAEIRKLLGLADAEPIDFTCDSIQALKTDKEEFEPQILKEGEEPNQCADKPFKQIPVPDKIDFTELSDDVPASPVDCNSIHWHSHRLKECKLCSVKFTSDMSAFQHFNINVPAKNEHYLGPTRRMHMENLLFGQIKLGFEEFAKRYPPEECPLYLYLDGYGDLPNYNRELIPDDYALFVYRCGMYLRTACVPCYPSFYAETDMPGGRSPAERWMEHCLSPGHQQRFIEFTADLKDENVLWSMRVYCFPQADWIPKRPGVTCRALLNLQRHHQLEHPVKVFPLSIADSYVVVHKPIHKQQPSLYKHSCRTVMKVLAEIIGPPEKEGQIAVHTQMILKKLPKPRKVNIQGILLEGNFNEPGDRIDPSKVTEQDLAEAERQGKMVAPTKDTNVVHWFAAKLTECKLCKVKLTPGLEAFQHFNTVALADVKSVKKGKQCHQRKYIRHQLQYGLEVAYQKHPVAKCPLYVFPSTPYDFNFEMPAFNENLLPLEYAMFIHRIGLITNFQCKVCSVHVKKRKRCRRWFEHCLAVGHMRVFVNMVYFYSHRTMVDTFGLLYVPPLPALLENNKSLSVYDLHRPFFLTFNQSKTGHCIAKKVKMEKFQKEACCQRAGIVFLGLRNILHTIQRMPYKNINSILALTQYKRRIYGPLALTLKKKVDEKNKNKLQDQEQDKEQDEQGKQQKVKQVKQQKVKQVKEQDKETDKQPDLAQEGKIKAGDKLPVNVDFREIKGFPYRTWTAREDNTLMNQFATVKRTQKCIHPDCSFTDPKFLNTLWFREHWRVFHMCPSSRLRLQCPACRMEFYHSPELDEHMSSKCKKMRCEAGRAADMINEMLIQWTLGPNRLIVGKSVAGTRLYSCFPGSLKNAEEVMITPTGYNCANILPTSVLRSKLLEQGTKTNFKQRENRKLFDFLAAREQVELQMKRRGAMMQAELYGMDKSPSTTSREAEPKIPADESKGTSENDQTDATKVAADESSAEKSQAATSEEVQGKVEANKSVKSPDQAQFKDTKQQIDISQVPVNREIAVNSQVKKTQSSTFEYVEAGKSKANKSEVSKIEKCHRERTQGKKSKTQQVQGIPGQQKSGQQMMGQQTSIQVIQAKHMMKQQLMKQQAMRQQNSGQQMTGQQMMRQQMTGQQMTGQQMTGQQMTGQQMTGQQMTGQQMTGQQMTGQQMTGQQMTGQQIQGQQMPVQQMMAQQMQQQMMGQQMTQQQMIQQQMMQQQMMGQSMQGQQMPGQALQSPPAQPGQQMAGQVVAHQYWQAGYTGQAAWSYGQYSQQQTSGQPTSGHQVSSYGGQNTSRDEQYRMESYGPVRYSSRPRSRSRSYSRSRSRSRSRRRSRSRSRYYSRSCSREYSYRSRSRDRGDYSPHRRDSYSRDPYNRDRGRGDRYDDHDDKYRRGRRSREDDYYDNRRDRRSRSGRRSPSRESTERESYRYQESKKRNPSPGYDDQQDKRQRLDEPGTSRSRETSSSAWEQTRNVEASSKPEAPLSQEDRDVLKKVSIEVLYVLSSDENKFDVRLDLVDRNQYKVLQSIRQQVDEASLVTCMQIVKILLQRPDSELDRLSRLNLDRMIRKLGTTRGGMASVLPILQLLPGIRRNFRSFTF